MDTFFYLSKVKKKRGLVIALYDPTCLVFSLRYTRGIFFFLGEFEPAKILFEAVISAGSRLLMKTLLTNTNIPVNNHTKITAIITTIPSQLFRLNLFVLAILPQVLYCNGLLVLQTSSGSDCKVVDPRYNYQFDLTPLRKSDSDYKVTYKDYDYYINVCGPLQESGRCDLGTGVGACQAKSSDSSFSPVNAGKSLQLFLLLGDVQYTEGRLWPSGRDP